jgi:CheY-like chemotaxis protein
MIKILLVEDSKFQRISIERALVRAGYEMSCAVDGTEALRMARSTMPDIILLDLLLPKMSGLDVLKALKADPVTKTIAVIVMSGMSEKNAHRLQDDGAFAFLEKASLEPEKGPEKLIASLRELIKTLPALQSRATTA